MDEYLTAVYTPTNDDEIKTTIPYIDLYYMRQQLHAHLRGFKEWHCECCDKKVKFDNTKTHLKSKKHLKNYKPTNEIFNKLGDNEGDLKKMSFLENYMLKLIVEDAIKDDKDEKEFECYLCEKTLKKT